MSDDYYDLLGVDRDAPEEAILRAYREQAAKHHPDVSDDPDAEGRFKRLNRAKAVLTDEDRRRAYDRLGHDRFVDRTGPGDGSVSSDGPGASSHRTTRAATTGVDRSSGGFVGSVLGGLGGDWFAERASPRWKGNFDPWRGFEIDLESLLGGSRGRGTGRASTVGGRGDPTVETDHRRECPKCHGRGHFVHLLDTARGRHRRLERCERCDGAGTVPA